MQNRPRSSQKVPEPMTKPASISHGSGQIQNLLSSLPSGVSNDRYA
jgi:hypothetical protein